MRPRKLPLDKITLDPETQVREEIDQPTVAEYAALMEAGRHFPPVEVCFDGRTFWLWDGFHRLAAARKAGRESIDAIVRKGSKAQAIWSSLHANSLHGKPLTRADKRRAIRNALLLDEKTGKKHSDSQVGEWVGCSHSTVAAVRAELVSGCQIGNVTERLGKDGKTYPAKHAPKEAPAGEPTKPAEALAPTPTGEPPDTGPASRPAPAGDAGAATDGEPAAPSGSNGAAAGDAADATGAPAGVYVSDAEDPKDEEDEEPAPPPAGWDPDAQPRAPQIQEEFALARARLGVLCRALSGVRSAIQQMEKDDREQHYLAHLNVSAFLAELGSVYGRLKAARPHAFCPLCRGEGCKPCRGRGWMTRLDWQAVPEDQR